MKEQQRQRRTRRRAKGNESSVSQRCLLVVVVVVTLLLVCWEKIPGTTTITITTTLAFQQLELPQQQVGRRVKTRRGGGGSTSGGGAGLPFLSIPTFNNKRKRKPVVLMVVEASKEESSSDGGDDKDDVIKAAFTTSSSSSVLPTNKSNKRAAAGTSSKGPPQQRGRQNNNNNNRGNNNNNNTRRGNYNNYKGRRSNNNRSGSGGGGFDRQRTLNREITGCDSGKELLQVLASQQTGGTTGTTTGDDDNNNKKKNALAQRCSGGALNSVNFSTSLHRLARHSINNNNNQNNRNNKNRNQQQQQQRHQQQGGDRASILTDPRFALLLSCLAEALADNLTNKRTPYRIEFQPREFSNIGWALAKLKLAPPSSAMPLTTMGNNDDSQQQDVAQSLSDLLETKATLVREQVLEVAAQRRMQQQQQPASQQASSQPLWIPALSQLAGHILDVISYQVLTHSSSKRKPFQMQEYANLLWALATSGRADPLVFDSVITSMIDRQRQQLLTAASQSKDGDLTPESLLLSDKNNYRSRPPHHNQSQNQRGRQQQQQAVLRPQEWSNSIWAFATAQIYSEELLGFVAELLETQDSFVDDFKTQELSNTVWGVATLLSNNMNNIDSEEEDGSEDEISAMSTAESAALSIQRVFARAVIDRAGEFRTQELSNTLWAMATLGFGLEPSADMALNNYIVLSSDQLDKDRELMKASVDAIVKAALIILPRFRSQELNNLAWALARLVDTNDISASPHIHDVLEGIGLQLCDRRRKVTSQDIGTTLWSLSTLGFINADVYRGIVSRLNPRMVQRGKPQELSNTLWALAGADLEVEDQDAFDTSLLPQSDRPPVTDPVTMVFGLAGVELMRRPFEFKPQEMKDVLWSFSKIGIRHPRLFKATAEHLIGSEEGTSADVRGFTSFSRQGLGNVAWAFARQAQLGAEAPGRRKAPTALASNGRLAVYTTSFFDIGEVLIQRLFSAIAETALHTHDKLGKLKPQDLSNTAWTYSVLGLSHTGFMETAKSELLRRLDNFTAGDTRVMNYFKGQELANLLWALATLNIPAGDILESLVPYFQVICEDEQGQVTPDSIAKIFKRQELANIAWSCAVFGTFPKEMMSLLYSGLVGDDEGAASILADAHGDTGLQSQAIMSLIYVQALMDLEGKSEGLTLPPDFPDGWKQLKSNAKDDHMTETTIELSLSTSKIQRAVSSSFTRIGFDHVEEHVITMEEMANDHGVSFPPKPLEILSIDIANLSDKIAIEVDGPAHFVSQIDEVTDNGGHTRLVNGKLEYQFRWKGDKQQMNGPTALKDRLLSLLGWKVIHIPFWEWYALCGDENSQDDYCRRRLAEKR